MTKHVPTLLDNDPFLQMKMLPLQFGNNIAMEGTILPLGNIDVLTPTVSCRVVCSSS